MTDIKEAQGLEEVGHVMTDKEWGMADRRGGPVLWLGTPLRQGDNLIYKSDATAVIDQQGRRIELLDEANRQLRDRVAELGAMLKIATNEREVAEINAEHWLNNLKNTQEKAREDRATHRAELAALKSAPVVIPENLKPFTTSADYGSGWNDALSEVLRMNRSNTNEQ